MSYTGTVKFFNKKNKFGFIIEEKSKKEYYFHLKDIQYEYLTDGDSVSFDLQEQKRGPVCIQIQKKTD